MTDHGKHINNTFGDAYRMLRSIRTSVNSKAMVRDIITTTISHKLEYAEVVKVSARKET